MAQNNERLDQVVLEARRNAEKREQGYRAQALKLFPWVCGRCARSFDHGNLQLLEVHHQRTTTITTTPPDGSNWELLCTYCHENEHAKLKDLEGRSDVAATTTSATFNPFADFEGETGGEAVELSLGYGHRCHRRFTNIGLRQSGCRPSAPDSGTTAASSRNSNRPIKRCVSTRRRTWLPAPALPAVPISNTCAGRTANSTRSVAK